MTDKSAVDALRPWLHHAMNCASTEGYGERDGVRLTPQKPCDCGLDAALASAPAAARPTPAREGLDVERLARAILAADDEYPNLLGRIAIDDGGAKPAALAIAGLYAALARDEEPVRG